MGSNHFDSNGDPHMVDVSAKGVTKRTATAVAEIRMSADAAQQVRSGQSRKGDVLAVARIAAIGATKQTQQLIPLCHAIPIEAVGVGFEWPESDGAFQRLRCRVTCTTTGKTGIEMEAMTGASVAVLTVYDMLKSVDRAMELGPIRLAEKQGGASGHFRNPEASDTDLTS